MISGAKISFVLRQLLWITLRCNSISLCLGHLLKLIDYLNFSISFELSILLALILLREA